MTGNFSITIYIKQRYEKSPHNKVCGFNICYHKNLNSSFIAHFDQTTFMFFRNINIMQILQQEITSYKAKYTYRT